MSTVQRQAPVHMQVSWPNMDVLETRVAERLETLSLAIGLKVGRAAG